MVVKFIVNLGSFQASILHPTKVGSCNSQSAVPSGSTRRPRSLFELFIRKAHLLVELHVEQERLALEYLQVIIMPIIFPILVVSLIILIIVCTREVNTTVVVDSISRPETRRL